MTREEKMAEAWREIEKAAAEASPFDTSDDIAVKLRCIEAIVRLYGSGISFRQVAPCGPNTLLEAAEILYNWVQR